MQPHSHNMQSYSQSAQQHHHQGGHYPPPNCGYPPYHSWGYPTPYNAFPGSVFNSGGNSNGSGTQTNGAVKVGNNKQKSGGVDIGTIGGNHRNSGGGQQVSGDVAIGDIGCQA